MLLENEKCSSDLPGPLSAASAIFADGFVNEGVELVACERNVSTRGFTGVVRLRKLCAAAGRRRDEIPRARSHQLRNFAAGEKDRTPSEFGGEHDFGKVLDSLHAVKSCQEIRATSYRAVIREE